MYMNLYNYYLINRNGLWKERCKEAKNKKNPSAIARLIYACEIGNIDQHLSEDLKEISAELAAMAETICDQRLDEYLEAHDEV